MKNLFERYGRVSVFPKDKRGAMKVWCFVNTSFNFLLPKTAEVPDWILLSKSFSLSFLAGYVDAEGSFGLNMRGNPFFGIQSQDKQIMQTIQSGILPTLGITTKLHLTRVAGSTMSGIICNKDAFGVFMYSRENLGNFISALSPILRHPKRRADALKVFKHINHVRA